MTETNDQQALTARAMLVRFQAELGTIKHSHDFELVLAFCTTACANGCAPEDIARVRHAGTVGYGFFRDKRHMCSITWAHALGIYASDSDLAIMITTSGDHDGAWAFMTDGDGQYLISHNHEAHEETEELQGTDLMTAVMVSALTSPLNQKPPGLFGRLRRT